MLEPLRQLSRIHTSIRPVKDLAVAIRNDDAIAVGIDLDQPRFPRIELLLQCRKIPARSRRPPRDNGSLSARGPELHWRSVGRRDYNVWQHVTDFVSDWHNGMIA